MPHLIITVVNKLTGSNLQHITYRELSKEASSALL
jgi:hypothetical protein